MGVKKRQSAKKEQILNKYSSIVEDFAQSQALALS